MPRTMFLFLLVFSVAACGGSGSTDGDIFSQLDPSDGKADSGGFPSIPAELGGSYLDLEVLALPPGSKATSRSLEPSLKCLVFHAEAGQSFAAAMRVTDDGKLDPYLILMGPDKEKIDSVDDQWLLPMGGDHDAVLVHTAVESGLHYLFACDGDFAADGVFRVDLLALALDRPVALDYGLTNPALRAYNAELRELEDEVAHYIGTAALREDGLGYLETDEEGFGELPLEERADLNRVMAGANAHREHLFDECLRANEAERTAEAQTRVGRVCGEVWKAIRAVPAP